MNIVITCGSCGVQYTKDVWRSLPLCGIQDTPGMPRLELRHCPCGSTGAVEIARGGNLREYQRELEADHDAG